MAAAPGVVWLDCRVAALLATTGGVRDYVEAARLLKQRYPHVEFCLLGFLDVKNPTAVSSADMDDWVRAGVVEYLGVADDVKPYLTAADCVVLPSYREGVPRSLLEAAAMGRPIVTTERLGVAKPLGTLAKRQPFTLRIIGGGAITMPGVEVESLSWSIDTEAALIAECDIGIMPLRDTPWEQGKCAYKLIQYMACGLPTVASPIGANRDVVIEGETGLFADSPQEWINTLATLLNDVGMCQSLGQAGRVRAESEYSLQMVAPKLVTLLKNAVRQQ